MPHRAVREDGSRAAGGAGEASVRVPGEAGGARAHPTRGRVLCVVCTAGELTTRCASSQVHEELTRRTDLQWALYRAGQGEIGDFEHAHTDAEHVRAELDVEACFGIFRTLQEDPRAPRITPVNFSISKRFLGGQELVIQLVVEDDAEGPPRARVRRGTAL